MGGVEGHTEGDMAGLKHMLARCWFAMRATRKLRRDYRRTMRVIREAEK